METLSFLLLL